MAKDLISPEETLKKWLVCGTIEKKLEELRVVINSRWHESCCGYTKIPKTTTTAPLI